MSISKHEQRAWDQLHKTSRGRIWNSCDLCKTFMVGLVAGFIITFICTATL
jgi:hypothetical protein